MATIQIVLEPDLLKAANQQAKAEKINRSTLIRRALHDHLRRIQIAEMEEQEQLAFKAHPQTKDEILPWEGIAVWPED